MSSRVARLSLPAGAEALLATWCRAHLGSPPVRELFRSGWLSAVVAVELADGRQVVIKVRPADDRLAACVEVQRHLHSVGYPCPEPLVGPEPLGSLLATAEALVEGGDAEPTSGRDPAPYAEALADLVRLAKGSVDPSMLQPSPPWVRWAHQEGPIWPLPDDFNGSLNVDIGPHWLDEAGRRARAALAAGSGPLAIGHCDWYTGNLRWKGNQLHVVHDWDSVIADREAVITGFASAVFCTGDAGSDPDVDESKAFLHAYEQASGRPFSANELADAWAAGLWIRAYDAKKQAVKGEAMKSLTEGEAAERLRRASR